MSKYRNGHRYATVIKHTLPSDPTWPYVLVHMLPKNGHEYTPVIGKMDTGASLTALTFATAKRLGISDPRIGYVDIVNGVTATGQAIDIYRHDLVVDIQGHNVLHIRRIGFAKTLSRNLFGLDWTDVFCIVFDSHRLHLLK